jgi:uncharacterized membrane protein
MDAKRFWRHVLMSPLQEARHFPSATLDAIQREIAAQEKRHRGEVCFVVEAELTSEQLWRDLAPRARARELFALRGVWNTEENNGVLIYVLLADRAVEIVADRGVDRRVLPEEWREICRAMQAAFAGKRFEEGSVAGVRAVSDLIVRDFPSRGEEVNELPDRPVLI